MPKPLYVAVGNSAKLATSEDGASWTQRSNPLGGMIAVAFGMGVWLASDGSDNAAISYDGENWSTISIGSTGGVWGFAHNGSTWVAVDGFAQTFTSPDGVTWTPQTNPLDGSSGDALWAIAYDDGNGVFIAVGEHGVGTGAIITSSDGVSWSEQTPPADYDSIACVAAGNGTSVIGKTVSGTGTGFLKLASSTDAVSWTERSAFSTTTRPLTIGYGKTGFVAAGTSGTLLTSPDGVTWTSQTSSFGTTAINGVTYGHAINRWVAVGGSGKLAISDDVVTWTQQTSSFGSTAINAVAWGGTAFTIDAWVDAPARFSIDAHVTAGEETIPRSFFLDAYVENDFFDDLPVFHSNYDPARNRHDRQDAHFGMSRAIFVQLSGTIGPMPEGSTLEEMLRYLYSLVTDAESMLRQFFTIDAYISEPFFTLDAIVRAMRSGSFTVNSIVLRVQAGSFTIDGYVAHPGFTIDAYVSTTRTGSFTIDGYVELVESGLLGDHTLARHMLGGALPTDPIIAFEELTLDAWIKATPTEGFTVDAHVGAPSETGLLGDHTLAQNGLGGD